MARLSIPVVLVSIPFFTSIANAVSCYNPLGEQVTNDFQPCIAVDGIHSSKYLDSEEEQRISNKLQCAAVSTAPVLTLET